MTIANKKFAEHVAEKLKKKADDVKYSVTEEELNATKFSIGDYVIIKGKESKNDLEGEIYKDWKGNINISTKVGDWYISNEDLLVMEKKEKPLVSLNGKQIAYLKEKAQEFFQNVEDDDEGEATEERINNYVNSDVWFSGDERFESLFPETSDFNIAIDELKKLILKGM